MGTGRAGPLLIYLYEYLTEKRRDDAIEACHQALRIDPEMIDSYST
jgi:hypothetical protein